MANLTDLVQKVFYLGVGLAAYAGEKAGTKLFELRDQAQKLADEMVTRGEMTAEEALRWMEEITHQPSTPPPAEPARPEPRRIEINAEDDDLDRTKPG